MVHENFFLVKVSIDGVTFKSLKFRVQSSQACERLLHLVKTRNKYVKNAQYQFTLLDGSVHIWRFNNTWFKATGHLLPILADVRKSIVML